MSDPAHRRKPESQSVSLDHFPIVVEIPLRWGEMDAFRHINNVYFFRYFEVARVEYFTAIDFSGADSVGPILATTSCRFQCPLVYPDRVWAGARVTKIDNDRFEHEYILVSHSSGRIAATGEGVIVSYDYQNGQKTALPTTVRTRIEILEDRYRSST